MNGKRAIAVLVVLGAMFLGTRAFATMVITEDTVLTADVYDEILMGA